jgi:CDP-glucose 4,6-dehydratase
VEDLVNQHLFGGIYNNKKVLVTGHTGFKGSWLCYWLDKMGAEVLGYSLPAPTNPSHFELLNSSYESVIADIRETNLLNDTFNRFQPDIVFHMAAQPLVRLAYELIDETYETNVMGSLRVYEACRQTKSVKSIVSITTDKVYENLEEDRGFVESDPLGGKDPYSASKAAMEVMTNSYRHSYFHHDKLSEHNKVLTTVRAGNVIGGGDWSKDRLIPDLIRAYREKETVLIRSPQAVRPWQHVLECLAGYLVVGQKSLNDERIADAYNFGPDLNEKITVEEVIKIFNQFIAVDYKIEAADLFESTMLRLNCEKAQQDLKWKPIWSAEEALKRSARWYRDFYEQRELTTENDLMDYINQAKESGLEWCK